MILKPFIKKLKERENNWRKVFLEQEQHLKNIIKIGTKPKKILWFHSASMGEFEQAKPIIELIKKTQNEEKEIGIEIVVVVTFYSPSGYNNQKKYKYADCVLYLPFDSRNNVRYFVDTFMPDLAIFIRYDIWFNYLDYLQEKKIPTFLISATFSNNFSASNKRGFFSEVNFPVIVKTAFYKNILNKISCIFSSTDEDYQKFSALNLKNQVISSGDTRIDRVTEARIIHTQNPILPKSVFQNNLVVIIGSSWEEEEVLFSVIYKDVKQKLFGKLSLIIVPHEPTVTHLKRTKNLFPNFILLSEILEQKEPSQTIDLRNLIQDKVIIVDSIGKLLNLYASADVAFVGGGFKTGLHSVIEPASYGLPIICGIDLKKQTDAYKLKDLGGLFTVPNNKTEVAKQELVSLLLHFSDKKEQEKVKTINFSYINQNVGKSKDICEHIYQYL